MKLRRRAFGGFLAALLLATATTVLAVDVTGNGGINWTSVGWNNEPPDKWSFIDIGTLSCATTCGTVRISIDWDDGHVDEWYTTLPVDPAGIWHEYGDNGVRHAKVFIEDEDQYGNWLFFDDLTITINN